MRHHRFYFVSVVFVLGVMFVWIDAAAGATLFGSEVARDELLAIDQESGKHELIGALADNAITGLAYDSGNAILYGISPASDRVYRIDIRTADITPIGDPGVLGFGNANGLAYDSLDGVLYGTDLNTNTLFTIDLDTGKATAVGGIGGGFADVEGLAFDPATDTLFGLEDRQNKIIVIDQESADARALPGTLPERGNWRGLAFDQRTGRLYATLVSDTRLYWIDAKTGQATLIGNTGGQGSAVQGLTFVSSACSSSKKRKLVLRCKAEKIRATLKKAPPDTPVSFCLDEGKCRDAQTNRRGKAKTKWKNVARGRHTVEIPQCELEKEIECR